MATLEELREQWRTTYDNMVLLSEDLVAQRDALSTNIIALEKPHRERLKQLEEAMRPLVTPDTPKTGHGVKIAHRREYDKVTWDGKMLDGYMVHDQKLANFRKVTTVKASTSFSRDSDEG